MTKRDQIVIILLFLVINTNAQNDTNMEYNNLTNEEKNVIINKGTEAPFTGKYNEHSEEGTYNCKQCNAPLFHSSDKFDGHCGWPSFDDEIENAVKRIPDSDGQRTEIVCANCGGHLGHIFEGENYTDKNIRHCVNSISVNFEPLSINTEESKYETAIFAGGCFWGIEHHMQISKGVISTEVGYIGGQPENPTYEDVCSGKTGHAEAIKVTFDPKQTNYETLTKLFFEIHDPTQENRQGPDVGTQYRSEIFYFTKEQEEKTIQLINVLQSKGFKVATKLSPASEFYSAEGYHQDYYKKTGAHPYCHFYKKKF